MEKNLAAQQIIAGHKKGFNETIYISSPKDMEETWQSANFTEVDSYKSVGLR